MTAIPPKRPHSALQMLAVAGATAALCALIGAVWAVCSATRDSFHLLIPPDRGSLRCGASSSPRGTARVLADPIPVGTRRPRSGNPLLHNRCLRRRATAPPIRTTSCRHRHAPADGIDLLRHGLGLPPQVQALLRGPLPAVRPRRARGRRRRRRSATSRASSTNFPERFTYLDLDDPRPDGTFPREDRARDPVRRRVAARSGARARHVQGASSALRDATRRRAA